jgi:hypothetical protein
MFVYIYEGFTLKSLNKLLNVLFIYMKASPFFCCKSSSPLDFDHNLFLRSLAKYDCNLVNKYNNTVARKRQTLDYFPQSLGDFKFGDIR